MEGTDYDKPYFEKLCRWLWEMQKEVRQPKVFSIHDLSLKGGPTKMVEHIQLYIDTLSAADVEISEDYTEIKVYPHR